MCQPLAAESLPRCEHSPPSTPRRRSKYRSAPADPARGASSQDGQHLHGGVVAGDAADSAAALGAGAAKKDIFEFGLDAPRPGLIFVFREWKRRSVVKNVPMIHA